MAQLPVLVAPAVQLHMVLAIKTRPALRSGHWKSLELLEDSLRARAILERYANALGHPVYLRPTNAGIVVISLDPASPANVGVGTVSGADWSNALLPIASAKFESSVDEYRVKLTGTGRKSGEERFLLQRIREAVVKRLHLTDKLLFLHQEWRLPSSDKIDILAVDGTCGQLVVVEAKKSKAATLQRDKKARRACDQAEEYAAQLVEHWDEYVPYFRRLATALGAIYRNGEGVTINSRLRPRSELWWASE